MGHWTSQTITVSWKGNIFPTSCLCSFPVLSHILLNLWSYHSLARRKQGGQYKPSVLWETLSKPSSSSFQRLNMATLEVSSTYMKYFCQGCLQNEARESFISINIFSVSSDNVEIPWGGLECFKAPRNRYISFWHMGTASLMKPGENSWERTQTYNKR